MAKRLAHCWGVLNTNRLLFASFCFEFQQKKKEEEESSNKDKKALRYNNNHNQSKSCYTKGGDSKVEKFLAT